MVTLNEKITYYIDPSDITGVRAFMSLIYNTASSQVLYRKKQNIDSRFLEVLTLLI